MEHMTEINLYNNELVLTENKLFFQETLIYDFEDRIHNISSVGVDQQLQVFFNLVKMMYETSISHEEKAEKAIILSAIFKILSRRNSESTILCIGESDYNNIFAYILSLFGKENFLYEICHNKASQKNETDHMITYHADTYRCMDIPSRNQYSILIINYDIYKDEIDVILDDCNRMLEHKGVILCYGSGTFDEEMIPLSSFYYGDLYQLGTEVFVLIAEMNNQKTRENDPNGKKQILDITALKDELRKELDFIQTKPPTTKTDKWYASMDEAILLIAQIESVITKNFKLLDNKELKFQTNEVKMALLDLKYEAFLNKKNYELFRTALLERYQIWVDHLS